VRTALGVFLGTISRSMAQFAVLIILVIVVLQLLSGGSTPVESQPQWLQSLTYFLPSRRLSASRKSSSIAAEVSTPSGASS
jgi:ABC-2 type transport system permease protein